MRKVLFMIVLGLFLQTTVAQPIMIAHRGASHFAPENTVASAKLAWELGADAVELDVHLSKDGQVMVNHDKTTKRTSGENHLVKNTESTVLRQLDVGSCKDPKYAGEKIPFLSEMIATIPKGKTLVVEIKCGPEVIPAMKKISEESGKQGQIVFIAFGWKTIQAVKEQFPNNACYWLSAIGVGLKSRMKKAAELGLDGVDLKSGLVKKDVMALANQLGLKVLCWTVDDASEAQRLAKLGVEGITTNRAAWLKKQL